MSFHPLSTTQAPRTWTWDFINKLPLHEMYHHCEHELSGSSIDDIANRMDDMVVSREQIEKEIDEKDLESDPDTIREGIDARIAAIATFQPTLNQAYSLTKVVIRNLTQHYLALREFLDHISHRMRDRQSREVLESVERLYLIPGDFLYAKNMVTSGGELTPGKAFSQVLGEKLGNAMRIQDLILEYLEKLSPNDLNLLKGHGNINDQLIDVAIILQKIDQKIDKTNPKSYGLKFDREVNALFSQLFKICSFEIIIKYIIRYSYKIRANRADLLQHLFFHKDCTPTARTFLLLGAFSEGIKLTALFFNSRKEMVSFDAVEMDPIHSAVLGYADGPTLEFLANRFKIDVPDEYGQTPLHVAAAMGLPELVRVLLKSGANALAKDKAGNTPLLVACSREHHYYCKQIERSTKEPEMDDEKRRALCVQQLIQAGSSLDVVTTKNYTLIGEASKYSLHEALGMILEARKRNGLNNAQEASDWLYNAVRERDIETVKVLLMYGGSINVRDEKGITPLFLVQFMQRDKTSDEYSQKCKELYRLILGSQVRLDWRDNDGHSVLSYAIVSNRLGLVLEMIENRQIDVNLASKDNQTPLHHAFRKYIEYRHKLTHNDCIWTTIAEIEFQVMLYEKIILALINRRPFLDAKDNNGVTPLMLAASAGNMQFVRLLIQEKAKLEIQDNNGKTALDYVAVDDPFLEREMIDLLATRPSRRQSPSNLESGQHLIGNSPINILQNFYIPKSNDSKGKSD